MCCKLAMGRDGPARTKISREEKMKPRGEREKGRERGREREREGGREGEREGKREGRME